MTQTYNVNVNGQSHQVEAEADTPLLHVIRTHLRLTGSRFGCGAGSCGACMVLLDGRPTPSCNLPVWAAEGKTVVTVEGLAAADGTLHAVQQAFLDEQAGQCGYCVSGIIVSAVALLEGDADPDATEIATALDRHLCRCGIHQRAVRAVLRARSLNAGAS
jgi:nicotinate dehydrogenase subunit A